MRGLYLQDGVKSFIRRLDECKNCPAQYLIYFVQLYLSNQQDVASIISDDSSGRYYINHETKTTSWDDPRKTIVVVNRHEKQDRFYKFALHSVLISKKCGKSNSFVEMITMMIC